MRNFAIKPRRRGGSRPIFAATLLLVFAAGASPAQAEDLFGFLGRLFGGGPRVSPAPLHYRPAPYAGRRIMHRRARLARAEEPSARPAIKPKPMGEVTNPIPQLLADSTLRRGDIVMFPDGPRVFTGLSRKDHALADFERISTSTKAISPGTRKLLANIRPGSNDAWALEPPKGAEKLASVKDVETTGSIRRRRR